MTGEVHEAAQEVSEVLAVDYDRTIGSVDCAMDRLFLALQQQGLDEFARELRAAHDKANSKQASFTVFSHLQAALAPTRLKDVCQQFALGQGHRALLYPDAIDFLNRMNQGNQLHFAITYGSEPWQRLKMHASGYEGGVVITPSKNKGSYMQSMRGEGVLPYQFLTATQVPLYAKTLCLIDDKPEAFYDLPQDCRGFCIRRPDMLALNQQELARLPASIEVITSLDELVVSQKSGLLVKADSSIAALQYRSEQHVSSPALRAIIRPAFREPWPMHLGRPAVMFMLQSNATDYGRLAEASPQEETAV